MSCGQRILQLDLVTRYTLGSKLNLFYKIYSTHVYSCLIKSCHGHMTVCRISNKHRISLQIEHSEIDKSLGLSSHETIGFYVFLTPGIRALYCASYLEALPPAAGHPTSDIFNSTSSIKARN